MMGLRSARSLARFYYHQRVKGFVPPAAPHLDPQTSLRFEELLSSSKFYLEFGSGGSTLRADALGVEAISVECDPYFAQAVRDRLRPNTLVEVVYASIGVTREWGRPVFRDLTPARIERWRTFCEAPFARISARGRFPDFVLVDGRFRRACALESARQALAVGAPTTIMVDDYYDQERDHYYSIEAILGPPARVGRAAVFGVNRSTVIRVPTDADLADAHRDFR